MKVLVLTQFFYPENFHINLIVKELSNKGHEITILTTHPSYPNKNIFSQYYKKKNKFIEYNNCKIIRVPSLSFGKSNIQYILNYSSFFLSASTMGLWKLRKKRFDLIFIYQTSPAFVIIPAIILKKYFKIPVVLWVLDLWPDALIYIKKIKNKYLISLLHKIMNFLYLSCDLILTQSRGIENAIKNKINNKVQTNYFPTFQEKLPSSYLNAKLHAINFDSSHIKIIFTGNIGEAQDFETILKAARELNDNKKIKWYIVGQGNQFDWLKNQISKYKLDNFFLLGHFPETEMKFFYENADALLVSLKPYDIYKITVPGKIQSYLMSGKPIIGSISGEAKEIIKTAKAGLVSDAGDHIALKNNILDFLKLTNDQKIQMGLNGLKYANLNYDKNLLIKNLDDHLRKVVKN